MGILGEIKSTVQGAVQAAKDNPDKVRALGVAGAGVVLGAGAAGAVVAVKKRAAKKKHAGKKHAGRKGAARKGHAKRASKKHGKPRARGGVHNGRRVLIAKNGTRYVRLKNGQVRFIK